MAEFKEMTPHEAAAQLTMSMDHADVRPRRVTCDVAACGRPRTELADRRRR